MRQLGMQLDAAGRTGEARAQFNAALQLARDLGDRRLECEVINDLGSLEHSLGLGNQALVCYEHALTLARGFGDRSCKACCLATWPSCMTRSGELTRP